MHVVAVMITKKQRENPKKKKKNSPHLCEQIQNQPLPPRYENDRLDHDKLEKRSKRRQIRLGCKVEYNERVQGNRDGDVIKNHFI